MLKSAVFFTLSIFAFWVCIMDPNAKSAVKDTEIFLAKSAKFIGMRGEK